jgi:hypothetical protein
MAPTAREPAGWRPTIEGWTMTEARAGRGVAADDPRAFLADVPWRAVWLIGAIGVALNIVLSSYGVAYSGAVPAGRS